MNSRHKIAASRRNGRKSRGPKTTVGKLNSSRNGLRHGLTTIDRQNALYADEIQAMAITICDGDENPSLREQALIIAECEILLRCIQSQSVQLIERLRDPALRRISKIKNVYKLVIARAGQNLLDIKQLEMMFDECNKKAAMAGEQDVKPIDCSTWSFTSPHERDEHEAICEALPDLLQFQRYERRAYSRQKRALRNFIAIKARFNSG